MIFNFQILEFRLYLIVIKCKNLHWCFFPKFSKEVSKTFYSISFHFILGVTCLIMKNKILCKSIVLLQHVNTKNSTNIQV